MAVPFPERRFGTIFLRRYRPPAPGPAERPRPTERAASTTPTLEPMRSEDFLPDAEELNRQRSHQVRTDPALRGRKSPQPHRLQLHDGRTLEGNMYRDPQERLVDGLYGTRGNFICLLNARSSDSPREIPFLVINLDYVVLIEEL